MASGDGKRRQAKMTQLLELAEKRVTEAEQLFEAAAKRASRQKTKRRRGTNTEPVPPKKKRRGATPTLDESLQTLREVEGERACLQAPTDAMCLGYDSI